MQTLMEFERDDQHPKHNRQLSMQNSSLKIPFLPEELITEILLRLPVKSLLQFRCVSKSWLVLISTPEFVKTQLSISANSKDYTHHRLMLTILGRPNKYNLMDCSLSSLLCDSVAARAFELDYPMKHNNKFAWMLGSVNGLFCLFIKEQGLFFWNPSLRMFKKFSDNSGLAHHFLHGIGYDEHQDDYKVLVIFNTLHHREVRIYSLNSDSWTSLGDFQSKELCIMKMKGMFVNGKLHWSKSTLQTFRSYNGWDIISFDLADGKWGKLEMPYYGQGDFDLMPWVTVLGSDLSVCCNYKMSFHTDVWIMKVYGVKESWTKLYSTINSIDDPVKYYNPILYMLNKGEILFQFGSSFMIYNPKDDPIRYEKITNCDWFGKANIYIESLVWPFCQNESGMQQR